VLAIALFVVIELEVDQPLLDLRALKVGSFAASLVMLTILQANLFGLAFFVPTFLQEGQHKEAYDAGILLLPAAIVTGICMPMVGRLYDRIGAAWLGGIGLVICGYGTFLLCQITPDMTRADVILWMSVRGFGLGLSIMPIMTAGLAALPAHQTNAGSALNNVARQSGGALGLAALSALATQQQAQIGADSAALVERSGMTPETMSPQLFASIYGRYEYLSSQILAHSYSDLFLLLAVLTAASGVLAVFLRSSGEGGDTAGASAGAH
jgi:MFS family permease